MQQYEEKQKSRDTKILDIDPFLERSGRPGLC
jgi:hypothetical protein